MSQAPKMQELEIPIHTELAVDLHDAEQLLFKVVQMLNRLEFKSHKHFRKESRQRADVLYTQARLLRESIGNEFQQYFVGWGKYDEARLQYAYRGGGREEIETRFNKVEEVVKVKYPPLEN